MTTPDLSHQPAPDPAPDPSMDDILASIRRILNEEEAKPTAEAAGEQDVLELDQTMMLPETDPPAQGANPPPEPPPAMTRPAPEQNTEAAPQPPVAESIPVPPPLAVPFPPVPSPVTTPSPSPSLVTPGAAAAAAVSVGALMRTLATERSTAVHRGGPTIEDLVREEIRPLLAAWLDTNLPPLVERLVRAEIERVVSRMS